MRGKRTAAGGCCPRVRQRRREAANLRRLRVCIEVAEQHGGAILTHQLRDLLCLLNPVSLRKRLKMRNVNVQREAGHVDLDVQKAALLLAGGAEQVCVLPAGYRVTRQDGVAELDTWSAWRRRIE